MKEEQRIAKEKRIKEKIKEIDSISNNSFEVINKTLDAIPYKNIQQLNLYGLEGIVDLAILTDRGFTSLKQLRIIHSKVVSLKNLPKGLLTFECKDSYLRLIPLLPNSLKKLDLEDNLLEVIEGSRSVDQKGENETHSFPDSLEVLNLSKNTIKEVISLPSYSLKELNISDNFLSVLSLKGLNQLRLLDCHNNDLNTIDNIPASLKEISYYNNMIRDDSNIVQHRPALLIHRENNLHDNTQPQQPPQPPKGNSGDDVLGVDNMDGNELSYQQAITRYFELKQTYEEEWKKYKKRVKETNLAAGYGRRRQGEKKKGKCVVCKKHVGNVFLKKDGHYIARCNACNFHIDIFNGIYHPFFDDMEHYKDGIDALKIDIIKQKLDVIFNHTEEQEALNIHKETIKKYSYTFEQFVNLFEIYQQIHQNKSKEIDRAYFDLQSRIIDIKHAIQTANIEYAIRLYNQLQPELQEFQKKKWEIREVMNNGNDDILLVKEHSFQRFIYTVEEPKVIHFVVKV